MGLAAVVTGASKITDDDFYTAAFTLSRMVLRLLRFLHANTLSNMHCATSKITTTFASTIATVSALLTTICLRLIIFSSCVPMFLDL